jgi:hypothetical protein
MDVGPEKTAVPGNLMAAHSNVKPRQAFFGLIRLTQEFACLMTEICVKALSPSFRVRTEKAGA